MKANPVGPTPLLVAFASVGATIALSDPRVASPPLKLVFDGPGGDSPETIMMVSWW